MVIIDEANILNINYKYNEIAVYDGEMYMVYYYKYKDFQRLLSRHDGSVRPNIFSLLKRKLTRSITDRENIYALDRSHWYSKWKHDRLVKHEIGHCLGKGHSFSPFNIMNPTWLFRWVDRPLKNKLIWK